MSVEPGSCHSAGTWNFKLAATFTENLCMSDVDRWKRADELEDFRDSTKVTGYVNYKCISGPRVARLIILHHSQHPQEHTLDVTQILCPQCCASFATNVSSDDGFTCAVNYLLNRRAIISNYEG